MTESELLALTALSYRESLEFAAEVLDFGQMVRIPDSPATETIRAELRRRGVLEGV